MKRTLIALVVATAAAAGLLAGCSSSTPEAAQPGTTTTAPPAAKAGPATSFGDGTWEVKTDIRPGTYRGNGGETCYWARLSGFTGDLDDIIANGTPGAGPARVTILASDAGFESTRCGTWTRVG